MKTIITTLLFAGMLIGKANATVFAVNNTLTGAGQFTQINSSIVDEKEFIEDTIFYFTSFNLKFK